MLFRSTHGIVIGGALLVVLSFIALGLEDSKIHEEVVESRVEH